MRVVVLHRGGLGGEQLGLGHVDEIGPEMQHERGLDVASVNAMAGIERRIEAPRQPQRARPTMPITSLLPPCELTMTSLRKPARCTPSPISHQMRVRFSAEQVIVPAERRCSLDFPIVWTARNSTRRSSGRRASTVLIMPSAIAVSVITGRCGPCCSVAATGRVARVGL